MGLDLARIRNVRKTEGTQPSGLAMESIFEKMWRLGPSGLVVKAIIAAIVADGLMLAFILLRRTYRKRYFARRDARVYELRQKWNALTSGQISFLSWRNKPFDR